MIKDWQYELIEDRELLPLFRPVKLKILVLVDSSISFTSSFGIGMMIDSLRVPVNSYVRFDVTLARRDGAQATISSPGEKDPTYTGFRFDQVDTDGVTPTLHKYYQVWCFGFSPGNDGSSNDANITNPIHNPTSDSELEVLTRWMNEQQGGVFATGDHHYLGASMCHRIPRVATMRKWTNAQGVPPISGPDRHDTNRPSTPGQSNIGGSPDVIPFNNQGDSVPQIVDWKKYYSWSWARFTRNFAPHPILCDGNRGVIDILPDHPHEGHIIEDADVVKTGTFNFDGYTGDEYPTVGAIRPLPEVIA